MESLLLDILITYLNGEFNSPGYNPVGGDERVINKYGENSSEYLYRAKTFLSDINKKLPEWNKESLIEYKNKIQQELLKRFSILDENSARVISNYVCYQYK